MEEPGLAALIPWLVAILITVVPVWRILGQAGFSPWWSLLLLSGVGFVLVLALLAFRPWKGIEEESS